MQKWDDIGVVISVARHGEESAIVRVFTAEHGLAAGMVKGALAKRNRGIYQPGNRLHIHWQARLEEHLGQIRGELLHSLGPQLLTDPIALQVMNAACAMVLTCVPERMKYDAIHFYINRLIDEINSIDNSRVGVLGAYVRLEMALLHSLGFGLDFTVCAANGPVEMDSLIYVSPKSGRAVSRDAGAPYKDKLLPLPAFLRDGAEAVLPTDMRQILDGLALTGYFLEMRLLHPEEKRLPDARHSLRQIVLRKLDAELV